MIRISRAQWAAALLAGAAMTGAGPLMTAAHAQQQMSIAAQPLDSALHMLMDATGIQITYSSSLSNGKKSTAIAGRLAPVAALSRMLEGTGLTYRQTGPKSFTLELAPAQTDGSVTQIGTLRVEGDGEGQSSGAAGGGTAGWDGSPGSVYRTPGSVSTVSRDVIERFAGTSPADLLRNSPGVLSGEARNSGGINVNMRGLQGEGRIAVTVDGTSNGTSVYRGYQGVGSRSYVDRDFIGAISVEKGPPSGPGGAGAIGGTVAMTTITADDIVAPGASIGLRFKGSLTDNSSAVGSGPGRSLLEDDNALRTPIGRPSAFSPGGGSASLTLGLKSALVDLVAGVSHRRSGNYHAGAKGTGLAQPSGPNDYCLEDPAYEYCRNVLQFYAGPGKTRFLAGEEVLNTSQDTKSALVKATLRFAPDHALELSYAKYFSRFGENYPASIYRASDTVYEGQLATSDLARYAARYVWDPASDLIHLKTDVWATNLIESSQALGGIMSSAKFVDMRGAEISNISRFALGPVGMVVDYGVQYKYENTGPQDDALRGGYWGREGSRNETSGWLRTRVTPLSWLMLDGSLRYTGYSLTDRAIQPHGHRSDTALGFSLGATVEPVDGFQLFATYRDAVRMPALLEGTRGFALSGDPALRPERAHDLELGTNFKRQGVIASSDKLGAKLIYFDNKITDYISRRYNTSTYSMFIFNIDRAQFRGFEASLDYSTGGFSTTLSASRYTHVAFCRINEPCRESSLASDYATNHIPPEFSLNALVTQKLFDERLTLSGRVSHIGKRVVPFERPSGGASPFISAIPWDPYTIVDLSASLKVADGVNVELAVENLGDLYYVEPLNLGLIPAPGRTFRLGITSVLSPATNRGDRIAPFWSRAHARADGAYDWTGFHLGASAGYLNSNVRIADYQNNVNGSPLERGNVELGDAGTGIYGVQGGYTYQLNGLFALGVEADYGWGKTDLMRAQSRFGPQYHVSTDDYLSVRGRFGVTSNRWMAFVTGGWAQLDADLRYQRDRQISFAASGKASGITLGGGVEYALLPNVSLRADYRYQDLKTDKLSATQPYAGMLFAFDGSLQFKSDQLRVGANVRF